MEMAAESLNNTKQCQICVIPIQQLVDPPPPPPECGGTALWEVEEIGPGPFFTYAWVLQQNNCVGGGVPSTPTSLETIGPGDVGTTETTDCDCP